MGLFNNGPVEICLDILVECPIDVGAIDPVVVRTYHDGWKFTGQVHGDGKQLRGSQRQVRWRRIVNVYLMPVYD